MRASTVAASAHWKLAALTGKLIVAEALEKRGETGHKVLRQEALKEARALLAELNELF